MNYLDERAMDHVEHRTKQKELNSRVFYRRSVKFGIVPNFQIVTPEGMKPFLYTLQNKK